MPLATRRAEAIVLGMLGVVAFSFTLPATRLALRGLQPQFIGLGRALVAAVLAALGVIGSAALAQRTRVWGAVEDTAERFGGQVPQAGSRHGAPEGAYPEDR